MIENGWTKRIEELEAENKELRNRYDVTPEMESNIPARGIVIGMVIGVVFWGLIGWGIWAWFN
jgi:hypothetical protein